MTPMVPHFTIDLPLDIFHRNKRYALNLNIYTRTHYRSLAEVKKGYQNIVLSLLYQKRAEAYELKKAIGEGAKCLLEYTIHPATARPVDISNPSSVVDKFTCDALQEAGILPDDNYHYITEVRYRWGGPDPTRPRITLRIYASRPEPISA